MTKDSPNLKRDVDIQFCETHRFPESFNPPSSTPRHIIKLSKIKHKGRIFKKQKKKEKKTTYLQGNCYNTINRFLSRHLTGQERVE